jgi:hypothetical protein
MQAVNNIEKPREGRKKFEIEFLSPLTGLLTSRGAVCSRLAPWATF